MRVAIKKQFLDRLSSVICHHRVLDFIFLGIPNRRFDLAQAQARAQALVQVQAQMPAFLAEAHADAEAQAQVQEPQEQVGEVQEQVGEVQAGNVNSANSPVVVS